MKPYFEATMVQPIAEKKITPRSPHT